jgi:hypothetical protein
MAGAAVVEMAVAAVRVAVMVAMAAVVTVTGDTATIPAVETRIIRVRSHNNDE